MTYTEANHTLHDIWFKQSGMPLIERILLKLFRKQFNGFAKTVISRAFERGWINSKQFHDMAGTVDKMLWPERYTERGSVARSIKRESV